MTASFLVKNKKATKKPVKPMAPEKKAAMLAKRKATKELKKMLAEKKRKRYEDDMKWYHGAYSSNY